MRISRCNHIIGTWPSSRIKMEIASATLFPTDSFYDEETAEWTPLSDFLTRLALPKPVKPPGRLCYCRSGLPFHACHGNSSEY
jgi:hypothetical protein